jgi:hypothetical protein
MPGSAKVKCEKSMASIALHALVVHSEFEPAHCQAEDKVVQAAT